MAQRSEIFSLETMILCLTAHVLHGKSHATTALAIFLKFPVWQWDALSPIYLILDRVDNLNKHIREENTVEKQSDKVFASVSNEGIVLMKFPLMTNLTSVKVWHQAPLFLLKLRSQRALLQISELVVYSSVK